VGEQLARVTFEPGLATMRLKVIVATSPLPMTERSPGKGVGMRVSRSLHVATALALGSLIVAATPVVASAKSSPRLFVSPSGALKAGQIVKVRGVGFKAHDAVFLTECLAKATGAGGCDIATATPVGINAKGAFGWTKFKVLSGHIGSGTCGTTKANLKNCAISAGNASGQDSATLRITFLAPKK
jgi:hypothetical protein